ncbi:sce7726 family protein [Mycobacteroides abscessus]|uniref:sce7726 family protein n=1 Tax=Mycobacteroides abscessus TaxID=36809 RepID=UPI0010568FA6|nr:sce7726 family protein [Mycobacteroides abscessus]
MAGIGDRQGENPSRASNSAAQRRQIHRATHMTVADGATEPLRDRDIRCALARRIARQQRGREFLFVPEIDVWGGWPGRIDQVLITRRQIQGFEIKSDVDSLRRLPVQVHAYSPVLERANLVTTTRHLDAARAIIPPWWGILLASRAGDGSACITPERPATANPDLDVFQVTTFVCREQIVKYLRAQGVGSLSRRNVYSLRSLLVEGNTRGQVLAFARSVMMERTDWRHRNGAVTEGGTWVDDTLSNPKRDSFQRDAEHVSPWLQRRIGALR